MFKRSLVTLDSNYTYNVFFDKLDTYFEKSQGKDYQLKSVFCNFSCFHLPGNIFLEETSWIIQELKPRFSKRDFLGIHEIEQYFERPVELHWPMKTSLPKAKVKLRARSSNFSPVFCSAKVNLTSEVGEGQVHEYGQDQFEFWGRHRIKASS